MSVNSPPSTTSHVDSPDQQVIVQLVDVTKAFDGKPVLRGISLVVKRGESVAVMGRSGTGKSDLTP